MLQKLNDKQTFLLSRRVFPLKLHYVTRTRKHSPHKAAFGLVGKETGLDASLTMKMYVATEMAKMMNIYLVLQNAVTSTI